jgi:hypothetical protein
MEAFSFADATESACFKKYVKSEKELFAFKSLLLIVYESCLEIQFELLDWWVQVSFFKDRSMVYG